MREATAIAFVLALLLGVLSISQMSTLGTTIQAAITSQPLISFVGFWPIIVVLLCIGMGVAIIMGVAHRR